MTQISRPFQLAIAAVAVLGLIWVFALRGHSSPTKPSSPHAAAATQPASKAAAPSAGPGKTGGTASNIYHGAAPGVEGLTRAIAKAHGAVKTSQQNAKRLTEESDRASSVKSSSSSSSSSSSASSAPAPAKSSAPATATKPSSAGRSSKTGTSTAGVPRLQRTVESELRRGRVVVLLFWNDEGADDVVVHRELQLLVKAHRGHAGSRRNIKQLRNTFGHALRKPIAVHEAAESQVAAFGSFTHGVQVLGTPTLLVIGKHGKTITLTGLQDAYSIEQTIDEARHA